MRTIIAARTDETTKKQAQHLFARLGMDMSTAINLFLTQAIRHQGLPFEVVVDKTDDLIKTGKVLSKKP